MSITLKDGAILPDLPEEFVTDEYPYTCIVITSEFKKYIAFSSAQPIIYIPAELDSNGPVLKTLSDKAQICFMEEEWVDIMPDSIIAGDGLFATIYSVVWSNHDILEVTDINYDTYEVTYADEPYFPSSIKPSFILPDGTELPLLPDGWSDETPYGAIVISFGTTLLLASTTPFSFVSKENLSPYGVDMDAIGTLGAGKQYYYSTNENRWVYDGELDFPALILLETEYIEAKWFNHDVNIALSFDLDTKTVELGELYRKSDVNFRITDGWMRSIADEARRFEETTNALTIDDIEETLKNVKISDLPNAMEVSF